MTTNTTRHDGQPQPKRWRTYVECLLEKRVSIFPVAPRERPEPPQQSMSPRRFES